MKNRTNKHSSKELRKLAAKVGMAFFLSWSCFILFIVLSGHSRTLSIQPSILVYLGIISLAAYGYKVCTEDPSLIRPSLPCRTFGKNAYIKLQSINQKQAPSCRSLGLMHYAGLAFLFIVCFLFTYLAILPFYLPQEALMQSLSLILMAVLGGGIEEFFWRGYLSPKLAQCLGDKKAYLAPTLCAIVWAFWHLPLVFVSFSFAALIEPIYIIIFAFVLSYLLSAVYHYFFKTYGFSAIIFPIALHSSFNVFLYLIL